VPFDLTILDFLFFGVIIISTLWAFARGGVFETVATTSWIVSAVAARFVSPWLETQIQQLMKMPEPTVTTFISSYFIIFFFVLILFSLFAQRLRDYIHSTILRSADRSLGIIFGLVRGVFVNGFIYIGLLWYWDGAQLPNYVKAATTRPIMQMTSLKIFEWFIPGSDRLIQEDLKGHYDVVATYERLINPKVRGANAAQDLESEDASYREVERQSLDNMLLQIENSSKIEEDPPHQ